MMEVFAILLVIVLVAILLVILFFAGPPMLAPFVYLYYRIIGDRKINRRYDD